MTQEITRKEKSFLFRFQPIIALRKYHDFDVPLISLITDEYENGFNETFFTLFGLGFGIRYDRKVKMQVADEKSLEDVSKT